jgi:hypothetical protein
MMRHCNPGALLICLIVLALPPVFAHRDYEHVAGTFQRKDGTTISVVQHYGDGILGPDPVSVRFRLPDGTEIAQTAYILDAVAVRSLPFAVEIYQYPDHWVPVASRVQAFDGYRMSEVTPDRRFASVFVHFRGHALAYFVTVAIGASFVGLLIALLRMPTQGWRAPLRWIGFGFVAIAGVFYLYGVLVFGPVSPLVLMAIGIVLIVVVNLISRKRQSAAMNEDTTAIK